MTTTDRRAWRWRLASITVATVLVATSCSSGDDQSVDTKGGGPVESGLPANATPHRGGQLVYGLEAESDSYCLSSAQVAISGMQVIRAIYDPLTLPDSEGGYAPYLAKSITPSNNYKTWTIELRPGIKFHDGSNLTATVVKNNLDAYRGAYDNRDSLLFQFALDNIDTVSVQDELTVKVATKVPWVAFPAHLYNSGRIGIMAQAQLDAPTEECRTQPIGTGPFSFVSWDEGTSLKVTRNADYWQEAPDGKPYPYLNAIDFRSAPNSDIRLADLLQGELNMMHTSTQADMADNLPRLRDEGAVNLLVSEVRTETAYTMFNSGIAPFNNREVRLAAVHAMDRDQINEETNKGAATNALGPFAPGVPGYLEDPGYPKYDMAKAKAEVKALKAAGEDLTVTFVATIDPTVVRQTVVIKRMLEEAGFDVNIEIEVQAELISRVIGGDYQLATFRNQPGEDPDMNRVWWYGGNEPTPEGTATNLVNFGRFYDTEMNRLFDEGRSEDNKARRKEIYEAINRRMASQVYNAWGWFVKWAVVEAPNVHGILGPDLPGDSGPPSNRLVTGHSLLGIWIDPPADD